MIKQLWLAIAHVMTVITLDLKNDFSVSCSQILFRLGSQVDTFFFYSAVLLFSILCEENI